MGGLRGVGFHRASGLWHARVTTQGRTHSLGYHRTPELASEAVRAFRESLGTPPDAAAPSTVGAAAIPLRRRDSSICAYALVDAEDAALADLSWSLNGKGYVVRSARDSEGVQRTFSLSRVILGLAHGDTREVDHENRNPLDNRRANLRILTHADQLENVPGRGGSSVYRGVTWNKQRRKWAARASIGGQRHHLGYFDDEQEAARVARDFRREHMPYATD